jgi:uncharacterized phiE125 gp8 family phage protein
MTTSIVAQPRTVRPSLVVYAAPATQPLSLDDAKAWLRVDVDDENGVVDGLIQAATSIVEDDTARRLIEQTIDLTVDSFPCGTEPLELYVAPVSAVSSVTYYDETDTSAAFSSANWFLDSAGQPARLCLKQGCAWPTTRRRVAGVIRMVVGWSTAESMPPFLVHAVKMRLQCLFEKRDLTTDEQRFYDWCIGPWILPREF